MKNTSPSATTFVLHIILHDYRSFLVCDVGKDLLAVCFQLTTIVVPLHDLCYVSVRAMLAGNKASCSHSFKHQKQAHIETRDADYWGNSLSHQAYMAYIGHWSNWIWTANCAFMHQIYKGDFVLWIQPENSIESDRKP